MRYVSLLLCLFATSALGQSLPVLDQNPTSLRWYQLKTPHFRVIYPAGFAEQAQRTAQRLEQIYEPVSATLQRPPRPVSIVLQNQTTVSNGFVSLLPRRSEFFTVAPQDPFLSGTNNWLDLLAVHEFRHVVQYEKGLQGFSRAAYTLLGYGGLAGLSLGIPDWFFEGDAVMTETLLSPSGRGRIPNFDLGQRANLLGGRLFSYPKAVGGSLRDNVPDHYVLGYPLTAFARREFGAETWSRVLNRYFRFPLYPFSFSNSLKKETGLRVETLYQRTVADMREQYAQTLAAQPFKTDATAWPARVEQDRPFGVGKPKPVFTNYEFPQWLNDTTLLALKSGLGDIRRYVAVQRNGREQRIYTLGLLNNAEFLSAAGGRVVWAEFRFDPRWGQRVWSELLVLDLFTKQRSRLSLRSRYTAAALSPDGRQLIAVRPETDGQTRLVVVDAETGREITTLSNPDNTFYQQPRWTPDGRAVVAVALRDGQKSLVQLNVADGQRRELLPPATDNLSHPQPWGHYVLFNSPRSGIDNIYAVNVQTGQQFQVTGRPLGAYHAAPSPNGQRLAFHDFTADGFRLADMPLDTTLWRPISVQSNVASPGDVRYFGPLLKQEPGAARTAAALQDSVTPNATSFPAKRYNRLAHALNIYGYGPLVSSNINTLTLGVNSQDLLNTTQLSAGYAYNQAERTGNFFANLSYQALYPVIDVGFQSGNRSASAYVDQRVPRDSLRRDVWQYDQFTAGVRLPFRLTRSKFNQNLQFTAYYNYLNVRGYDLPARPFLGEINQNGPLSVMSYGLSYSWLLRQAPRDVAPRVGVSLSMLYRNTPFQNRLSGEQFGLQTSLYLPGIGRHHGLRLRGGYQQQQSLDVAATTYNFGAAIFFPRGYQYVVFDKLQMASAEYRLPLAHPHWSLGRLLYVQRVTLNGFVDVARGESTLPVFDQFQRLRGFGDVSRTYQSVGLDVLFTFNPLRLRTPLEAGVRVIYQPTVRDWVVQPLVIDIGF